ncbi:MAG: hypothetical protein HY078_00875 [Elusimicrobia bacterium]|nr:hypothetical protein [Elusimicrobiota bacterium]
MAGKSSLGLFIGVAVLVFSHGPVHSQTHSPDLARAAESAIRELLGASDALVLAAAARPGRPKGEAERPGAPERGERTVGPSRPVELPDTVRDVIRYHESVERRHLAVSTFQRGAEKVREKAAEEKGDWAVVLDVDDTVLDTKAYWIENKLVFELNKWNAWVREARAPPVPGAVDFIHTVRTLPRGKVVYITDRLDIVRDATIENLRKHGLFEDGDLVLTKKDASDTKNIRRACVQSGTGRCASAGPRRIIALFGDSLRDFIELHESDLNAHRRLELEKDPNWNESWFLIPNPLYGHWQKDFRY